MNAGIGVGVGSTIGFGVGVGVGAGPEENLVAQVYANQENNKMAITRATTRISLPQGHSPTGRGRALAGICADFGAGFGAGEAFSGVNPSHDRVSGLTCMPYLTPAWLALVQLKNFSPGFGLKLAQLPHISLLIG